MALPQDTEITTKAGYVAIAGRPNVGKSTLINTLLGQKIAAVSPKPQTTRKRQLGILTEPRGQIIFIDTPGIHKPLHKLGKAMNWEAVQAFEDADVVLFMVDVSRPPHPEDELVAQRIQEGAPNLPVVLALNKADAVAEDVLQARREAYEALAPQARPVVISALTGQGLDALLALLFDLLPVSPPYYDDETLTDLYERDIAADLIREAALLHLRDEVPHSIAVRIDEYKERGEHGAYIAATLFVERDSQKGIVIGKGGSMLKQIGTTARQAIEAMSGRKVFLDLRVKVSKNWRNNASTLRRFGYRLPPERP
ncbi:MAG TPA: GTPase Era [Anaerolineae bacterium]|nr:GTPase Era [Anaerolineae bacterium]HID84022.1 GTPase Era [Anaerolineales bacterium]HIQ09733.1 GTPase Era [Anaerolineaceae bacterium]